MVNSVDLHYIADELKILEESIFEKAYQGGKAEKREGDFLFSFRKRGKGKLMLRIILPDYIFLAEKKPSFPKQPPGFCMFLRKHLSGYFVKGIAQKDFDRIIEIVFEKKSDEKKLIIELIPPGNIVLIDKDGKIISLLRTHNFKDRTLRGGVKYEPPPKRMNIKEMDTKEIVNIIINHKKDSVVKALAIDLGLSGKYAEKVCIEAGIDKKKREVTKKDAEKLAETIKSLFKIQKENLSKKIENNIVKEEEALEEKVPVEVKKAKRIIEQQTKSIEELEKKSKEEKRKAELIYENYTELKRIMSEIKELIKEKDYEKIDEIISKEKLVKSFDKKNKRLILDIK